MINFLKDYYEVPALLLLLIILVSLAFANDVPSRINEAIQQNQEEKREKQAAIQEEYQEFKEKFIDVLSLNRNTVATKDKARIDEALMAYTRLSEGAKREAKEEKAHLYTLAYKIAEDMEEGNVGDEGVSDLVSVEESDVKSGASELVRSITNSLKSISLMLGGIMAFMGIWKEIIALLHDNYEEIGQGASMIVISVVLVCMSFLLL